MILDKQQMLSEEQFLNGSELSTNFIDLGDDGDAGDTNIELLVQVTETFAGGTSLVVSLVTDDSDALGTSVQLYNSRTYLTAELTAGTEIARVQIPHDCKRYIALAYTVVGVNTAGKVDAGLVLDRQSNLNNFG